MEIIYDYKITSVCSDVCSPGSRNGTLIRSNRSNHPGYYDVSRHVACRHMMSWVCAPYEYIILLLDPIM